MNEWARSLHPRLRKLERQATKAGTREENYGAWTFVCAPSLPPDRRVHMRGGWVYENGYWVPNGGLRAIDGVADFASEASFHVQTYGDAVPYSGAFVQAFYYLAYILCWDHENFYGATYGNDTGPPAVGETWFNVCGDQVEYPTAAQAENSILDVLGTQDVYQERMPLRAVILHNDGQVGVTGAVQPIDAVNRGRSYLWLDLRPRHCVRSQ